MSGWLRRMLPGRAAPPAPAGPAPFEWPDSDGDDRAPEAPPPAAGPVPGALSRLAGLAVSLGPRGPAALADIMHAGRIRAAVAAAGTGAFQHRLLLLTGAAQAAAAAQLSVLPHLAVAASCDRALAAGSVSAAASSLSFGGLAGVLLGVLVAGASADRAGRRPALLASLALCAVAGVLSAAAPSLAWLVAARTAAAAGAGGASLATAVHVEWLPRPASRAWQLVLLLGGAIGGAAYASAASWALMPTHGWRGLALASAAPAAAALAACYAALPESPRFLFLRYRFAEAYRELRTAADVNGAELQEEALPTSYDVGELTGHSRALRGSRVTLRDQLGGLASAPLGRTTAALAGLFALMAVLHHYVQFAAMRAGHFAYEVRHHSDGSATCQVDGAHYALALARDAAQVPGLVAAAALMERVGRRGALAALAGASFACLAAASVLPGAWLVELVLMASQAAALGFRQALIVYTVEVYPTPLRAFGLGAGVACASSGQAGIGMLSGALRGADPLALCAAAAAGVVLLAAWLPYETRGCRLSDSVGSVTKLVRPAGRLFGAGGVASASAAEAASAAAAASPGADEAAEAAETGTAMRAAADGDAEARERDARERRAARRAFAQFSALQAGELSAAALTDGGSEAGATPRAPDERRRRRRRRKKKKDRRRSRRGSDAESAATSEDGGRDDLDDDPRDDDDDDEKRPPPPRPVRPRPRFPHRRRTPRNWPGEHRRPGDDRGHALPVEDTDTDASALQSGMSGVSSSSSSVSSSEDEVDVLGLVMDGVDDR